MLLASQALMPTPPHRFSGSPSHWALPPRARLAIVVLMSMAACSGSSHSTDDGDDASPPSPDASESPGDTGQVDAGMSDAGPDGASSTVIVAISGPGRITSKPAGIDCGAGGTACTARFAGDVVVLTTDNATTVRWSGACSGNGDCAVALGADRAVTADTFAPLRRTFDGPDHGSDACYAIAAGPGDSIVVAGAVQRLAQGHNAWARAYDAGGGVTWSYELSTPSEGHDRGNGVIALPDGGALVAGTWFSGSNTRWNSFALHLIAAGTPAWSKLDEIVGDDMSNAIARDASGRLFVAGAHPDAAGQTQAWLRALSSDGHSELWAISRDGTATGPASASGVAVDSVGDVIAGGSETNAGTGPDGWIAKYSPQGALRWSSSLASPGTGADWIAGVAVAPDDSIAVVGGFGGSSSLRVYDAAGTPRWDVTAADGTSWTGVAVDAAGDVVVTGSLGTDLVARKYTPAGTLLWQRTLAGARGNAVAIDGHGNILVCGTVTVAGNTDGLILGLLQ
jgi:hypothetical protein